MSPSHDMPDGTITMSEPLSSSNPFPGLRPFRQDEHHRFFGRECQVDAMVDKLASTRFLTVIGTSGSGKSSLVNCGLFPALHLGLMASAGPSWRITTMRPGGDPLKAMGAALAKKDILYDNYTGEISLEEIIDTHLRLSKRGFIDVVSTARLPSKSNLLLVVDQFEELFRYATRATASQDHTSQQHDEATAFVNLLLEVKQRTDLPIYVVLTMRSDFLGDCTRYSGLAEAMNEGQYLVPRLTRDERREAIEGPVRAQGAKMASVLLTRLVNDVGDNPDQLSILQHALNRTWSCWEKRDQGSGLIELVDYETIGTMAHALDHHAEKAHAELDTEEKKRICEKLFKALTDKGTDARGTRRPLRFRRLCAITNANEALVREVIEVFRKPSRSFLMPPRPDPLEANPVVDISHESLMRVWSRLKTWVHEEADSARVFRRLAETARLHAKGKAEFLGKADLTVAEDWFDRNQPTKAWAKTYDPDFELAISFLEQSREDRDQKERENKKRQQHELEQAKRLAEEQRQRAEDSSRWTKRLFGLAVVSVLLALGAGKFWYNAYQAQKQAEKAKEVALSKELIYGAVGHLPTSDRIDPELSVLLSLEGEKYTKKLDPTDSTRIQTIDTLHETLIASRLIYALPPQKEMAEDLVLVPHENFLMTVGQKSAQRWNLSSRKPSSVELPRFSNPHPADNKSIHAQQSSGTTVTAFSEDGKQLVVGRTDESINLWENEKWNVVKPGIAETSESTNPVTAIAIHPKGTFFAAGHKDGKIIIGAMPPELQPAFTTLPGGDKKEVYDLVFDSSSQLLASASKGRPIRIWRIDGDNPELLLTLPTLGKARAQREAMDFRDSQLVVGYTNGRVQMWGIRDSEPEITDVPLPDAPLYPSCGRVSKKCVELALNPEPSRTQLAIAEADGTVRLLNTKTWEQVPLRMSQHALSTRVPVSLTRIGRAPSLKYSADGKLLAVGLTDGSVQVFSTDSTGGELPSISVLKLSGGAENVKANDSCSDSKIRRAVKQKFVKAIAFSDSKIRIAVAQNHACDIKVQVWEDSFAGTSITDPIFTKPIVAKSGHRLGMKQRVPKVKDVILSPNGVYVAIARADDTLKVYNLQTHSDISLKRPPSDWENEGNKDGEEVKKVDTNIRFSGNGSFLASVRTYRVPNRVPKRHVVIWDVAEGKSLRSILVSSGIKDIQLNYDGKNIVIMTKGDEGQKVQLFEVSSGERLVDLVSAESEELGEVRPTSVLFGGQGDREVIIGEHTDENRRKVLSEWDPQEEKWIPLGINEKEVVHWSTSRLSNQLLAVHNDRRIRVWDLESGERLSQIPYSGEGVKSIVLNDDETRLAILDEKYSKVYSYALGQEELVKIANNRVTRTRLRPEECDTFSFLNSCQALAIFHEGKKLAGQAEIDDAVVKIVEATKKDRAAIVESEQDFDPAQPKQYASRLVAEKLVKNGQESGKDGKEAKAIAYFRKARELNSEVSLGHYRGLKKSPDPEDAAEWLVARFHVREGQKAGRRGDEDAAIQHLKGAQIRDPEVSLGYYRDLEKPYTPERVAKWLVARFHVREGQKAGRRGDEDAAIQHLKGAQIRDPEVSLGYYRDLEKPYTPERVAKWLVARFHLAEGKVAAQAGKEKEAEAIRHFKKAHDLDNTVLGSIDRRLTRLLKKVPKPEDLAPWFMGRSYIVEGRMQASKGNVEDAITAFRNAEKYEDEKTLAWSFFRASDYGKLCWDGILNRKADRVIGYCRKAVEKKTTEKKNPKYGGYRDSLGVARVLTGDWENAKEDFQYYVKWAEGEGKRPKSRIDRRKQWVRDIEDGKPPFDERILYELASE